MKGDGGRKFIGSQGEISGGLRHDCLRILLATSSRRVSAIGTLPERRMNPARITQESVMNWAREILGERADFDNLFFITIRVDKN